MQTPVPSTNPRIPFGLPIIYYNHWTGFETDRFRGQFKDLSGKEVGELSKGASIFVDVDPIHPNGKVYGYFKGQVTDFKLDGESLLVSYECKGSLKGCRRVDLNAESTGFLLACDEDALADLLEELPLAKVIDHRF